jgi:hypothetical protein
MITTSQIQKSKEASEFGQEEKSIKTEISMPQKPVYTLKGPF